jgi:hypothetical protein
MVKKTMAMINEPMPLENWPILFKNEPMLSDNMPMSYKNEPNIYFYIKTNL